MAALRCSAADQLKVWDEVKLNFSAENLQQIADNEFHDIITELTHMRILQATTRVKNESAKLLEECRDKLTKELDALRMQLASKTEELSWSTAKMFREIDKCREKTYAEAEAKFIERIEQREYHHQ